MNSVGTGCGGVAGGECFAPVLAEEVSRVSESAGEDMSVSVGLHMPGETASDPLECVRGRFCSCGLKPARPRCSSGLDESACARLVAEGMRAPVPAEETGAAAVQLVSARAR